MAKSGSLNTDELKQLRRAADNGGWIGYIGLSTLAVNGDAAVSLEKRGYFRRRLGTFWVYAEFELTLEGRNYLEQRNSGIPADSL